MEWGKERMRRGIKSHEKVAGRPHALAERYGVPVSTVWKLIREGRLKATRVGRRLIVKFADGDALFLRGR